MTLILTNDDGIDAPGIQALEKAITSTALSKDDSLKIIIAAPQEHQSGCGHQVTTISPISVSRRSEFAYAIAGTPADCVRIAIAHISQEIQWVISGINAGGNLGVDAYISGTVAAVREAAMHGIPGIAISHYRQGKREYDWQRAAMWTGKIIVDLLQRPLEAGSFWNVNLPHLLPEAPEPEIIFCPACTKPLPINYRVEGNEFYYAGVYQNRDRTPGSDVDVCFGGNIAITQLRV
ncbi:5'/3'-nucleotidase SurE [Calothrix sp. 336/3]|uniref:5'/3'-nucleotidase SurE n=1 Tax=Calothrix sp. 336/3 TaxID=1337936 RepID=UPI0004E2936D|nr:5'/3'-nucleotidase SurE [Calothrix sp. 336/3]AKG23667.1 stationary phase survival protein SurE [Calothrix sp. 336/3]